MRLGLGAASGRLILMNIRDMKHIGFCLGDFFLVAGKKSGLCEPGMKYDGATVLDVNTFSI